MRKQIPLFLNVPAGQSGLSELAGRAEAAGLDAIVVPDGPPSAEPTVALAALAASTERIGLIATLPAGCHDPLELARRVADLDYLSNGRAGWRVAGGGLGHYFGAVQAGDEKPYAEAAVIASVLARWDERTDLRSPQGRPVLVGGPNVRGAEVVLLEEWGLRALPGREPGARVVLQQIGDIDPDRLENDFTAVDGFAFQPADLERFFEEFLPELRRRGLLRSGYTTRTLRGHLGLEIPAAAVPASRSVLAGSR
ncbi:LLM class flavin-dependent oxidoreductase [Kineosporia babensis]|uniref:LLM class flavin-dependent oxidoreductase n=1 Tax=Kineosporia babensis TaxID=499548 RepID=A0A9X1T2R2_9ACTN|nr:LLM class flavin-dependent oxidoreductase [Kineosporia babensis]MCD5314923.1 LLM class flavin-dependent oxidoreductase [Kineosporia babensis]